MKHSPLGRDRMLAVRMDDAEFAAAEATAKKYGLSLPDLARTLLTVEGLCENLDELRESPWLAGIEHAGEDDGNLRR